LDIQLTLNNENVEQVKEAVFFGVILDENLSWKSHAYISHTANKISKSIGVIFKASFYLPLVSLRILSMIYPYLQYCNMFGVQLIQLILIVYYITSETYN
jgi:uncharacterized membrane protein YdbT with pleckstrin-like domain